MVSGNWLKTPLELHRYYGFDSTNNTSINCMAINTSSNSTSIVTSTNSTSIVWLLICHGSFLCEIRSVFVKEVGP